LVAEWIPGHARDEVLAAFVAHRVPAAPVNDVHDLFEDPHLTARGDIERMTSNRAPALDEHHDEVLGEWLPEPGT
jgi:crotonobetainyl-CoA:carnitine CoA-transferase CaiB-like acyl-CoA transferase